MKKKAMRMMICVALAAMVMSVFSVTAFAAGDVATAIENTWNTAQSPIKAVVNNVVFPVIDMILAILSSARRILTTASTDSLSLPRLRFCSPV